MSRVDDYVQTMVFLVSQVPTAGMPDNWTAEVAVKLLAVFLLIGINAFFVAAEFSIVSVRRSRINQLVGAGDVQARTVQDLQRSLDRLLSTTQLGITLSSLALGWIGETAMVGVVASWLGVLPLPQPLSRGVAHSIAIPITFFGIAYLQIVLGELCPKSVALTYSEQLARVLGAPSLAIARIFNPFIWILNQSTRLLLRCVGIPYFGQGWYNQVTSEELQLMITTSTESTGLEAGARQLLQNVFEFGQVTTGEVMIPRTSIAAIPHTASLKAVLEEVATSRHARYPIIGESLDDVRGVIHLKELAEPIAHDVPLHESIAPWIRPARYVQEYLPLNELLVTMQRLKQPIVLVVDEFGGTAGMVTIEDVVAEILGDSVEVNPVAEPTIQILAPHTFSVQAQINLEELNDSLKVDLPLTDEYQTLAGFVLFQCQRIPKVGEVLIYGGYELTVISMEGPRLHQIQIRRLDPPAPETETELADRGGESDVPVDVRDRPSNPIVD